jgi:hypothetical protein
MLNVYLNTVDGSVYDWICEGRIEYGHVVHIDGP